MRVRLLVHLVVDGAAREPGYVAELPDRLATELIRRGRAEPVRDEPAPETAEAPERSTAERPRPRRRRS